MDSQLDPVKQLKDLLEFNVSNEQLYWFSKLFNIYPASLKQILSDKQQETELIKKVNKKPIKGITENTNVDDHFTYLYPDELLKIAGKYPAKYSKKIIKHKWSDVDNNVIPNIINYIGDSYELIQAIFQMLPVWERDNKSVPLSFILPFHNDIDVSSFENQGDGWEVFNYNLEQSEELIKTFNGELSLLSALQLRQEDPKQTFIPSLLKQLNASKEKSIFSRIDERYPKSGIKDFCISEEFINEIIFNLEQDNRPKNKEPEAVDENTVIIPRFAFHKNRQQPKLNSLQIESHFETRKKKVNEGATFTETEKDMRSMRGAMSFLLTHTSGVIVTFNFPNSKQEKFTTPTLILPKAWDDILKSTRSTAHFKHKQLPLLTEEQVEKLVKKYQNSNNLRTSREFIKLLLDMNIVKKQFPIRTFPNPKQPDCYPQKN